MQTTFINERWSYPHQIQAEGQSGSRPPTWLSTSPAAREGSCHVSEGLCLASSYGPASPTAALQGTSVLFICLRPSPQLHRTLSAVIMVWCHCQRLTAFSTMSIGS